MSYVLGTLGSSSIDTATVRSAISLAESITNAVKAFARSCVEQGVIEDDARTLETEANNVRVAVFIVSGAVDRGATPDINAAVSNVRSAVSTVVDMAASLGARAGVSASSMTRSVQAASEGIIGNLNSLRFSGGGSRSGGRASPPPPPLDAASEGKKDNTMLIAVGAILVAAALASR